MKQPNIILIFSDQHNPMVCGYEGDQFARTPNLDRLADNGTRLRNCYCASPLCVPSRTSLLTGLLPTHTGVFNNRQALASDIPTVAHSLTIAGYETVLCGRMHFLGPDQRHGFQKRLVGDFTCNRLGVPNPSMTNWEETTGQTRAGIQRSGAGNTNVMEYDKAVIGAALQQIKDSAEDEKPLFMTIGLYGPHCPFVCPKDLFDYYYDILRSPSCPEDFLGTAHPAVRKWFANRDMLEFEKDEVRRSRAAYYGLVEINDRHVGTIIDQAKAYLDLENTVIIYASDHGDMIGHNGLFWKTNFYEGSARVPVIVSQPGRIAKGRVITHPTSLLDFPATLIDIAGASQLPETDGESWYSDLISETYQHRDRAVISMLGDVKGDNPSAMIRKGNWKLVRHYGYDDVQLFDLEKDPAEQNDLGKNDNFCEIRRQLDAELTEYWQGNLVAGIIDQANKRTAIQQQYAKLTEAPEDAEVWRGNLADNWLC